MLTKTGKLAISAAIAASSIVPWSTIGAKQNDQRPNILFIITDNQSPATLGCYGNPEIKTPNIDRMAEQGIIFQNAYACNGMSSPTRASIMTGLIPSQHGVHTQLSDIDQKNWPKNWSAVNEFRTLPQTLSESGYTTALIGKWHLGIPFKPQLKFDYWLTFPEGHTLCFYNNEIIDNGKRYRNKGHITDFWTDKAVDYINNYDGKNPFFLYLAYDAPYNLPPSISGPAKNRFAELYKNKDMCFTSPREPVNKMMLEYILNAKKNYGVGKGKWIDTLLTTLNDTESIRNIASQISLIDDGVGKVLEALKEKGLDKNTLIVFTSDQGIAYGQKGLWGQTENSIPSNLYETSIQVPLIFRQFNTIFPLQSSELLVNNYDLFPTLLDYIGLGDIKIENSPGLSFAPMLKSEKLVWNRKAIFFEQEVTRGIRKGDWKFVTRCPEVVEKLFTHPRPKTDKYVTDVLEQYPNFELVMRMYSSPSYGDELYNLKNDPVEKINLVNNPKYTNIKNELHKELNEFFKTYSNAEYDLWNGGTAKSNSNVEYIWKKIWPKWKPVTEKVDQPFTDISK